MYAEDLLLYEQEDVELIDENVPPNTLGKLRIVEKESFPFVEWACSFEDVDNGWAVIEDMKTSVSFVPKKSEDSVSINNCNKHIRPCSIDVKDVKFCKVGESKKSLVLIDKHNQTLASFKFHVQHTNYFFDVLHRYAKTRPQENEKGLYLVQNINDASKDDQLSDLNLVPDRGTGKRSKSPGQSIHHSAVAQWIPYAPKKVLGFLHDMRRDPYTTTLSTMSTVYDVILNAEVNLAEGETTEATEDIDVAGLLHKISGRDDFEPGFEILTKHEQLASRPEIERLTPLTHEEFVTYVEQDGSFKNVKALKDRIFSGGLHPNIRPHVWPLLLARPPVWHLTSSEREEEFKERERQYLVIKQQWKTISEEQESNFSGFRDRRSIIEKDVNRTDRSHPFFEGENNPNIEMLHDILMTFIMFNFDLGYVQGMSDLLAPILYVVQNEAVAFWTFVGHMDRTHRNFDIDQAGMKQQLSDLTQLLRILDPEFVAFLETQESANLYFCFRWLLVLFKRELNYSDTLRLWECLWTDRPCKNFHLLVASAIIDSERDELIDKKFGFTEILKHINCLSLRIDLTGTLRKAESMYRQLEASPACPDAVRLIVGLPPLPKPILMSPQAPRGLPGHATRVLSPTAMEEGSMATSCPNTNNSSNFSSRHRNTDNETAFEKSFANSFT